MTDLLVYAVDARADTARTLLASACGALGVTVRMETFGSGALYQRLSARPAPPPPDLVWWFGPFAARAAAADGLVQNSDSVESSSIGLLGSDRVGSFDDLSQVPRLSMADPARSEVGMALLLASLDMARRVGSDPETIWAWWQQRAPNGLVLTEADAEAASAVASGSATHALTLSGGTAIPDVASIPHVAGVAANSRYVDAAKRLLEWLVAARAASPATPALDVDWCTQNYSATRQRWIQAGFSPTLAD